MVFSGSDCFLLNGPQFSDSGLKLVVTSVQVSEVEVDVSSVIAVSPSHRLVHPAPSRRLKPVRCNPRTRARAGWINDGTVMDRDGSARWPSRVRRVDVSGRGGRLACVGSMIVEAR